jgi:DNA primase
MPLEWTELKEIYPTDFTVLTAGAEVAHRGDSWADILDAKVDLETRFSRSVGVNGWRVSSAG